MVGSKGETLTLGFPDVQGVAPSFTLTVTPLGVALSTEIETLEYGSVQGWPGASTVLYQDPTSAGVKSSTFVNHPVVGSS